MSNPINHGKLKKSITKAIKELNKKRIKGGIYFYKRSECTCCYGPKKSVFTIRGNYAKNQGCYGIPYEEHGYKVTFDQDQKKAIKIATVLDDCLGGSGWTLNWTGDVNCVMSIVKLHEAIKA